MPFKEEDYKRVDNSRVICVWSMYRLFRYVFSRVVVLEYILLQVMSDCMMMCLPYIACYL